MRRIFAHLSIVVILLVGSCRAGLIDPREVNLVIGSWTVDTEMMFAVYMVGYDPQALAYSATVGPNGWTGTLFGNYAGLPVLVNYTGTFIPTSPGNANIVVNSSGTIGGQSWGSSAIWAYSDPSSKGTVSTNSLTVSISARLERAPLRPPSTRTLPPNC